MSRPTLSNPAPPPARPPSSVKEDLFLRGFSCPQEPLDSGFLDELAVEHAREFARRFLQRARGQLACRGHGLYELVDAWCGSRIDFGTAFHPVQGIVRKSVLVPDDDPLPVAAQLGLHLSTHGAPDDWRIRLHAPVRLRCERRVLPIAVDVGFEGGRAVHGSPSEDAELVLPAVRLGRSEAQVLAPGAEAAFGNSLDRSEFAELPAERVVESYAEAGSILAEHAPDYLPWVERVVRELVPVSGRLDQMRSSSDEGTPGRITTSLPAHAAATAEMLVHESSHLYFNLARRVDEVVNGEDRALYDSPVKGVPRPLDRILIAYHAFANVALFYADCLRSGLEDGGYCEQNLARHRGELEILERPLVRTRGLTPLGRHLFEPLAERLERLP